MAKFSGGTFNDGVLSYVYEAKPGGRKNNVNIKQIGGEWFFVNKDGSKRTNLANKGKLSKTHIDNLKGAPGSSEENIFASANVSPETGKVAANIDTGGSGINTNLQGTGPANLEKSNYSLPQTQGVRPEMGVSDNKTFTKAPVAPTKTNTGSSFDSMANPGSRTWEGAGRMSLNTDPNSVPSSAVATAPTQSLSGQNEFTGFGKENMSGPGWGAPVDAQPSGNLATQGISEWGDKGFASEQAMSNSYSSASPSGWTNMSSAGPPGVEIQSTGFGGRPETPVGDNTFNTAQGSTTLGIPDKKDSPWGAEDWSAVGSVMKGVGGLASAYTGIKNYQLARDAFGAQKDQWQADYNQRLKAYEDNKALTNEEIRRKNRTLEARGQAASYKEI